MKKIDTKGLILRIFIPTIILTLSYLMLGHFCSIPHILLFCILGTLILAPIELGTILKASKDEYGKYSLQSAFAGQEKCSLWKVLIIAFVFWGIAGLLSALIVPIENQVFAGIRSEILDRLPIGFDWTNYEYMKTFPKPMLIITCVYYGIFNVLIGPVTEELLFRGYLTSHYEKQTAFTPIMITILFSFYHLWLPFNNAFRILAFAPLRMQRIRKRTYISVYVFIAYAIFFPHQVLYWRY